MLKTEIAELMNKDGQMFDIAQKITYNRNLSAETSEMLGYVNEVRKQYGLRELEGLELLDSAADVRANELLENYSHDRPDGNSYITAIEEIDLPEWRAAAEKRKRPQSGGMFKEKFFWLVIPVSLVFHPSHEPLWEGLQTSGTPVAGQEINGEYRCESGAVPPL